MLEDERGGLVIDLLANDEEVESDVRLLLSLLLLLLRELSMNPSRVGLEARSFASVSQLLYHFQRQPSSEGILVDFISNLSRPEKSQRSCFNRPKIPK